MRTEAGVELLRMLTTKTRVVSDAQLASADPAWTPALMSQLVRDGMVLEAKQSLKSPSVSQPPYASWHPMEPAPDFGAIAWRGRQRIRGGVARRLRIYWATDRAVRTVGGIGGKLRQPWQLQHDLGVTSIYLLMRRTDATAAERWVSEDLFRRETRGRRRGEKIADAYLVNAQGQIIRAVELVGDYPTARLREFHAFWSHRRIPYELR